MICITTMANHHNVLVSAGFMTDGTSASIALSSSTVIKDQGPANFSWVAPSFNNLLSTNASNNYVSYNYLPAQVPGEVSTLLWWCTPNLISIDRSMLNSGIET